MSNAEWTCVPPLGAAVGRTSPCPAKLSACCERITGLSCPCAQTNISSSMGYGMRDLDNKNQQVTVDFTLKRKPYWYRNEVLGPTILLVAISWAGFFIARAAVPARVAACVARHPIPILTFP
jgi:hypothetical protein